METFTFNPKAAEFDRVNARGLAQAAQLAYADQDAARRTLDVKWDFPKFRFFSKRGVNGYLAVKDSLMVLAFRGVGPEQMKEWLSASMVVLMPTPHGKLHTGFKTSLDAAWDEVLISFRLLRNRQQPIWITGHGIGAAFATLAAYRLKEENIDMAGLYTFGAPRVGDAAFGAYCAQAFPAKVYRVVNRYDGITRLPARQQGYDHVGTLRHFDAEGKLHDTDDLWQTFLQQPGVAEDFLKADGDGVLDHRIERYLENLKV